MTHKIFLSYRRTDKPGYVARVADYLEAAFGPVVFRDVESIRGGANWKEALRTEISGAEIVLAIIGDRWLQELVARDLAEKDFVREELVLAREVGTLIIPVLLDDVPMPGPEQLGKLDWITDLQGYGVSDRQGRWDRDLVGLVDLIASSSSLIKNGQVPDTTVATSKPLWWRDPKWLIGAVGIPLFALSVSLWKTNESPKPEPADPSLCKLNFKLQANNFAAPFSTMALAAFASAPVNPWRRSVTVSANGDGIVSQPVNPKEGWVLAVTWPDGHVSTFRELSGCIGEFSGSSDDERLQLELTQSTL